MISFFDTLILSVCLILKYLGAFLEIIIDFYFNSVVAREEALRFQPFEIY